MVVIRTCGSRSYGHHQGQPQGPWHLGVQVLARSLVLDNCQRVLRQPDWVSVLFL